LEVVLRGSLSYEKREIELGVSRRTLEIFGFEKMF